MPDASEPVIIVGGGLAGLSATLAAVNEGASVVLIEGEKSLGGNSAKVSHIHNLIYKIYKIFVDFTCGNGKRSNLAIVLGKYCRMQCRAAIFVFEDSSFVIYSIYWFH